MPTLAVCSWSLEPKSPEDLVAKVRAAGLSSVQLALGPLVDARHNPDNPWHIAHARKTLADARVRIVSGMMQTIGEDYTTLASIRETGGIVPDQHWTANLDRARLHARLACELNLRLVTFHAGFVPHDHGDPARARLIDRLRTLARLFVCYDLTLGLETGQESAATLIDVLRDANEPNLRVNFDPANMLLYGMGDPIAALRSLAETSRSLRASPSIIVQVHIKDAIASAAYGQWGSEVPLAPRRTTTSDGRASVDWPAFFQALREHGLLGRIDLVIEREAGESRVADVAAAASVVRSLAPDHVSHPLRVGVLGMGFMGQTHARAAQRFGAEGTGGACTLAAACDPRIHEIAARLSESHSGNLGTAAGAAPLDLARVHLATRAEDLLARDDVDLVIVSTPTDTHVPLARAALGAGKHVLVEKPVATTRAPIEELLRVARIHTSLACVPAMVMRWWPGWAHARGLVREGALGDVREVSLERMGQPPTWSQNFYADASRSGGALIDLHVHDVDFLCWTLGLPEHVASTGTVQHVESTYRFTQLLDARVHAVGSWQLPTTERFRMRMRIAGSRSSVRFDLTHEPSQPAGLFAVDADSPLTYDPTLSPYELQLQGVADAIVRGLPARCTLEDAVLAARVLDAERESLRTGAPCPI
jgi:predicted dehydrogenase/sugar phosphate isomerase/epimerase